MPAPEPLLLLERWRCFKRTVLSNLCKISTNPVLSLPENWHHLPNGYNTLHQLTFVPDEKLTELIQNGTITPSTTLDEAKSLRSWPKRNVADESEDERTSLDLKNLSPANKAMFFKGMFALADEHGVIVSDAKGGGALADWHREEVKKQALEGIQATKGQLTDEVYKQYVMLHEAAIELSKIKARLPCLPEGYKDFAPLTKLLSTEDITKPEIRMYCKDNKLPNPLGDQTRVQHEVYVWDQARLIAEGEDKDGALKRLKKMASDADNMTIRDLANRVLSDIAGFEPKAVAKKKAPVSDEDLQAAA